MGIDLEDYSDANQKVLDQKVKEHLLKEQQRVKAA